MTKNDRHDLLRWPSPVQPDEGKPMHPFEMQDMIARGVLKGGLWLAVILGSIALLLVVGKYGVTQFMVESSKQPNMYGF